MNPLALTWPTFAWPSISIPKFNAQQALATLLTLLLCFSLVSCSQSQVTVTLGLVVDAADVVVGVLSPGTAALITPYLNEVSAGVAYAVTELDSMDSGVKKGTKIAAYFATIIAPNLPAGTASTIVNAVADVAAKIISFLQSIQSTVALLARGPIARATQGGVVLMRGDKSALIKIGLANEALRAHIVGV